jgi:hypothetical protein
MTTGSIRFFQVLKTRLGEREAEAIVDYVDNSLKENNRQMQEILATKEDLANLRGELRTEIAEVKSDIIRWTFAFFVTLMLAILGLYLRK